MAKDYISTEEDVLRVQSRGFYQRSFPWQKGYNRFIHVDIPSRLATKFLPGFESATTIIFCVNLADYDQGGKPNRLAQSIQQFDWIVNLPCFEQFGTSIFLLLTHANDFQNKLASSPFAKHFPTFCGGTDAGQAKQYITRQFRQANRARLGMRFHKTKSVTSVDIRHMLKCIQDSIVIVNLKVVSL